MKNQCEINLHYILKILLEYPIFMFFGIRWHCFPSLPFMSESENLRAKIEILSSNGGFSVFSVR